MSHYQYPPLSPGPDRIRLLRLMPHKDEKAPIQCELFEYSLQESINGTHLYEALSYVWGSPETSESISLGKHNLPVTANVHAALSSLRDCSLERIIWADFICINQEDEKDEKERQIQSMAKIYGLANRVVVYLGVAADASDQALEDIRVAAEDESTNISNSEKSQKVILKLLERPWFQRIWILQEVALARRILIMCGSAEINGYTFCLGLHKLELSYEDHSDLQGLIRSITYLIRGAIFRPKYTTSPSGGLSLGELIDMYHTRESTVPNDKVYALLGMSSDDPSAAGLSPDYTVPWKTLLQRLIKFILFEEVSVETWDNREMAVIRSKGYILGHVSSVEDDSARYDRQHVNVVFNNTPKSLEYEREYSTRWTLQASAKSVRKGDFVCLLHGASKPTIIRAYKDHFAVIIIAVTLRQSVRIESGYVEREEPLDSAKSFYSYGSGYEREEPLASAKSLSHDFLLVWNWEKSQGYLQNQARYETRVEINNLVPEYLKTTSDKATRSCDVALASGDAKDYEETEKRLQEAIDGCERAFGKEDPHMLAFIDSLASIYGSQQQWTKAEDLFLQVIHARKRVQGIDHQDTLNSIANLASNYIYQDHLAVGKREMVTSLINRLRDNIQIAEEVVVQAAGLFGKGLMTLLLDLKKENVPVTEAVVEAAAGNFKEEVIALLLSQRGNEVKITEEVVKAAAGNDNEEVMALILSQRGDEVKITEEVVKAAAGNWSGLGMMKLLLSQRGDEVKVTEEVLKEAASNEIESYKVVQLLCQTFSINVTVGVIEAAATSGQEQVLGLLDQRDSIGSDKERWLNISRLYNAAKNGDAGTVRQLVAEGIPPDKQNIRGVTPLWRASEYGHKKVVEVLLATSAVEVNVRSIIGQTPLFWAAANGFSKVVRLLLDHGAESNYTDKNGESPLSIARFYGEETVIHMLIRHEPTTRTSE